MENNKYSYFDYDQITTQLYEQVSQKLLVLAENDETRAQVEGILRNGGFGNFSVNGDRHTEREVFYKNNPSLEGTKRLNMAYLLLSNPDMFQTIYDSKGVFFHGTNGNAIPSILKYGLNSVDKSKENDISVTTGEEWSRIGGKRDFVSVTDDLSTALGYAYPQSSDNLLNFGVIIGSSFEHMDGIKTCRVASDLSEVGVRDNLPLDNIKFLAVPKEQVEFVRKLVGEKDISVVSFDMNDRFYNVSWFEKLNMLEKEKNSETNKTMSYDKSSVKNMANTRKISRINKLISKLKEKFKHHEKNDKTEKQEEERGE